jgi:hypothetical protein
VSWLFVVLLAAAALVLIGAEWPRLASRFGLVRKPRRARSRRRASHLRLVESGDDISADEFAASVQRDLQRLPTIEEERDRRR